LAVAQIGARFLKAACGGESLFLFPALAGLI
jgi:hypothetical protein